MNPLLSVATLVLTISLHRVRSQTHGPVAIGSFDELTFFLVARDKTHAALVSSVEISESLLVVDSFKTLSSTDSSHVLDGRLSSQILVATRARLTFSNVAMTNAYGHAAKLEDFSRVEMFRCLFSGNRGSAAVLVSRGSALVVTQSTFVDNVASGRGGAIYVDASSSLILNGGLFLRNEAHRGGAVYIRKSTSAFTDVDFNENKARDSGGAVYVDNNSTANASSSVFSHNRAWQGTSIFVAKYGLFETINCTGLNDDHGEAIFDYTHTATTTVLSPSSPISSYFKR